MRVKSCRRFTVSDAMVLVAATALALVGVRYYWPSWPPELGFRGAYRHTAKIIIYTNLMTIIKYNLYILSCPAAAWTSACLALCLRRPRPTLRHLTRQPGAVACAAAVVVLAIRLINFGSVVSILAVDGAYPWSGLSLLDMYIFDLQKIPSEIGSAVAAAWVVQAVGGRWRPEPGWIDRMGRVLGVFWVGTIPFAWFSIHLGG
jgi:hypothetical protein